MSALEAAAGLVIGEEIWALRLLRVRGENDYWNMYRGGEPSLQVSIPYHYAFQSPRSPVMHSSTVPPTLTPNPPRNQNSVADGRQKKGRGVSKPHMRLNMWRGRCESVTEVKGRKLLEQVLIGCICVPLSQRLEGQSRRSEAAGGAVAMWWLDRSGALIMHRLILGEAAEAAGRGYV